MQLYGAYSEYMCFHEGELWRLFTYQFLHANLGHILFNMIALWFFGPVVEERFGHLRFLLYYLFCGVAAALFSSLLGYMGFFDPEWRFIPMVGASGSIYGIMAACAVLFPHARVQLLFPPVNLSVRQFALVVLGIACAVVIFQWNNGGRRSRPPGRHAGRVYFNAADPAEGEAVFSPTRFLQPPTRSATFPFFRKGALPYGSRSE